MSTVQKIIAAMWLSVIVGFGIYFIAGNWLGTHGLNEQWRGLQQQERQGAERRAGEIRALQEEVRALQAAVQNGEAP